MSSTNVARTIVTINGRVPVLLTAMIIVLTLGLWVFVSNRHAGSEDDRDHGARPQGYSALIQVLDEMHRSWRPEVRDRVLAAARHRREALAPAIMWILKIPGHPRFPATVELAGHLPLERARPVLADIARSKDGRATHAAILSAERIAPWTDAELASFLGGRETQQLAALKLWSTRRERPVEAIAQMLKGGNDALRCAALAALPDEIPPHVALQVVELAAEQTKVGQLARDVCGRITCTQAIVDALRHGLPALPVPARLAALHVLRAVDDPGIDRALLDIVTAGTPDQQAKALDLLSHRSRFDPLELAPHIATMPPMARFVTARRLTTSDLREGVRHLLELADDADGVNPARTAARLLLAELSRTPPHAGIEAWRAWYHDLPR